MYAASCGPVELAPLPTNNSTVPEYVHRGALGQLTNVSCLAPVICKHCVHSTVKETGKGREDASLYDSSRRE